MKIAILEPTKDWDFLYKDAFLNSDYELCFFRDFEDYKLGRKSEVITFIDFEILLGLSLSEKKLLSKPTVVCLLPHFNPETYQLATPFFLMAIVKNKALFSRNLREIMDIEGVKILTGM